MSIYQLSIRSRRLLAVVVVVALLALMATAFAGPAVGPARAAGPGAGMSLQIKSACTDASQLTTVEAGVPFVVCVISDPAPGVAIAGFTSEVLFAEPETGTQCTNSVDDDSDGIINDGCPQVDDAPEVGAQCLNNTDDEDNDDFSPGNQKDGVVNDGCPARTLNLKWAPRTLCTDEVQVGRQDAGMLAACNAKTTFLGGVGHVVVSEFPMTPPAAALDVTLGSTTTLIELDFTCNAAGSYKLTLTAAPDSANGAAYFDDNGNKINVKTVQQDYDGDTVANDVADTATFECLAVGGIAELPDVAGTPLETTASSDANLGLIVGVRLRCSS